MIDTIRAELDYRQERVRRDAVPTGRDPRRDDAVTPQATGRVTRPAARRPRPVR